MTGEYRIGVDVGSWNTAAVLELPDGSMRPVLFDGMPLLPSAVFASHDGTLLVGRDAAHAARSHPERYEPSPKRAIGEGTLLLGDREVPVADALAALLHRVRVEADRVAGTLRPPVVLTCPAGWGEHHRAVLREAAVVAFEVEEILLVEEPVAAAAYFTTVSGIELPDGATALVYDFGAGTFDASVVSRRAGELRVLAAEGLPDVGGLDIDAAVVAGIGDLYVDEDPQLWRRLEEPATTGDLRLRRQLWDDARTGKEMLSRASTTLIHLPLFDRDVPVGRERFDEMARPIVERTVRACQHAVAAAGVEHDRLAGIYLVGGSSRLPLVATLVHRAFGVAPTVVDQPELAVAMGSLHTAAEPTDAMPATGSWPRPEPDTTDLVNVPPHARPRWTPRFAAALATIAVAAVSAVVAVLVLTNRPDQPGGGTPAAPAGSPEASGAAPSSAAPSPTPTTLAQCLIGTWRMTVGASTVNLQGTLITVRSQGGIHHYAADGTFAMDHRQAPYTASVGGHTYELSYTEPIYANYVVNGTKVLYTNRRSTGQQVYTRDGRVRARDAIREQGNDPNETHFCQDDTLRTAGQDYSNEYVRVDASPTRPATM